MVTGIEEVGQVVRVEESIGKRGEVHVSRVDSEADLIAKHLERLTLMRETDQVEKRSSNVQEPGSHDVA